MKPGTVLRLGDCEPVPQAWRGKTVVYIGERDGWVYHGHVYPDIWFDKEHRRLTIGNRVKIARCKPATWWRRLHDSTVDPADYGVEAGALDTVVQLLTDRTSGTAPRTADTV